MLGYDIAATSLTAIAAEAISAAEGRWPRICERALCTAAQSEWVRCDHVL